jgi:hypothetical protein
LFLIFQELAGKRGRERSRGREGGREEGIREQEGRGGEKEGRSGGGGKKEGVEGGREKGRKGGIHFRGGPFPEVKWHPQKGAARARPPWAL